MGDDLLPSVGWFLQHVRSTAFWQIDGLCCGISSDRNCVVFLQVGVPSTSNDDDDDDDGAVVKNPVSILMEYCGRTNNTVDFLVENSKKEVGLVWCVYSQSQLTPRDLIEIVQVIWKTKNGDICWSVLYEYYWQAKNILDLNNSIIIWYIKELKTCGSFWCNIAWPPSLSCSGLENVFKRHSRKVIQVSKY